MYEQFYNLKASPFNITPDPDFLFLTESHKEALAAIVYGVEQRKGFIAISGEVGTGKTTIVRTYLKHNAETPNEIIYLFNPNNTFEELLKRILLQFKIEKLPTTEAAMVDEIHRILIEKYRENKNVVLIIDEAQNVPIHTLESLRMLSNLEASNLKLIQIILVGQPEFSEKLKNNRLRQLRNRIAVRATIAPLTEEQGRAYIAHRIEKVARGNSQIFTSGAVRQIVKHSEGIPRAINVACDNALVTGFGYMENPISADTAREVIKDIKGELHASKFRWLIPASVAALVAVWFGINQYEKLHLSKLQDTTESNTQQFTTSATDSSDTATRLQSEPKLDTDSLNSNDADLTVDDKVDQAIVQQKVPEPTKSGQVTQEITELQTIDSQIEEEGVSKNNLSDETTEKTIAESIPSMDETTVDNTTPNPADVIEEAYSIDLDSKHTNVSDGKDRNIEIANETQNYTDQLRAPKPLTEEHRALDSFEDHNMDITDAAAPPIAPTDQVGESTAEEVDELLIDTNQSGAILAEDDKVVENIEPTNDVDGPGELSVTDSVLQVSDEGVTLKETSETGSVNDQKAALTEEYQSRPRIPTDISTTKTDISTTKSVLLESAHNAMASQQWQQAKQMLETIVTIDPNDESALTALASLKTMQEQSSYVSALLLKAKDQIALHRLTEPQGNNAIATYRTILTDSPDNQDALTGIEEIKSQFLSWAEDSAVNENWAKAIQQIEKALEIDQDDLTAIAMLEETKIERLLWLAHRQINLDRLTRSNSNSALASYKKVLERDPRNQRALEGIEKIKIRLIQLAINAEKNSDLRRARLRLKSLLAIDKDHTDALTMLSDIDRKLSRDPNSKKDL